MIARIVEPVLADARSPRYLLSVRSRTPIH
jgi:hypothetical protein